MNRSSNKRRLVIGGTLSIAVFLATQISASAQGKPQRVRFQTGHSSTTIHGHINGFDTKDYVVGAQAGQEMKVRLTSSNQQAYFVISSINGNPTDMVETQDWSVPTTESGDYVIRVLMMRSAARRKGASANFSLTISIH